MAAFLKFAPEAKWWLIICIKPLFPFLSSKVLEDINQEEQAASHICFEVRVEVAVFST